MSRFDLSDEVMGVGFAPYAESHRSRWADQESAPGAQRDVSRVAERYGLRDLPDRFGPWQTVYHWFKRWRREGTLRRMADALQDRLHGWGRIDRDLWLVDSTIVRAHTAAAGARKKGPGRSRRSRVRSLPRWNRPDHPKELRRIAPRYDKHAQSFAAMIDLARTRQFLKIILSDRA